MNNSKILPIVLSWLIWVSGGAIMYHKYCGHDAIVISEQEAQEKSDPSIKTELRKESKVFEENSFQLIQPLSIGLSNQVSEYLEALKEDETKKLKIVGLYQNVETNKSLFPDIGLARASNLKQLFIQNEIDPARISLGSKVNNKPSNSGGLEFSFVNDLNIGTKEDYKMLFEHNPIILNFGSNKNELILTKEQRSDFLDLINYISLDPKVKVDVTGYTDNLGEREMNIKLSKDRARFVENELVLNGVDAERINVMAYGPERPLISNKTAEGRAKNRRVEISVE